MLPEREKYYHLHTYMLDLFNSLEDVRHSACATSRRVTCKALSVSPLKLFSSVSFVMTCLRIIVADLPGLPHATLCVFFIYILIRLQYGSCRFRAPANIVYGTTHMLPWRTGTEPRRINSVPECIAHVMHIEGAAHVQSWPYSQFTCFRVRSTS